MRHLDHTWIFKQGFSQVFRHTSGVNGISSNLM